MPDLTQAQRNAVSELLRVSPVIDDLAARFDKAGHRLYLVGGSVRDAMLGGIGHDLDFTTSASPGETHAILSDFTPSTWDIGRDFGTIGAMKREGDKEWQIEVTTFRADAYEPGSRKPVVAFGERIEEDLVRRDFTVNAMAVDVVAGEFVDPWGGLRDLADGVLRTPAPAEVSFSDDPLRMLRAARFASRLGFRVAPEVQDAMRDMAERITIVSAERVQGEFTGLLLTDSPREGLDLLVRTGVAEHFVPELPALRLERDEHMRHKDVYAHSLTVLEQAIDLEKARGHEPDIVSRLAALLHDVGKPATRRFEGSKVTFHHHDVVGAKLVSKRLKALKYSTAIVKSVAKLVELHLRFHGYGEATWSDSAVRRYVRDAGDELERLHILTRADCTTRNRNKATRLRRNYEELEWRIDELAAQEEIKAIRPDLDGSQIMEILGIAPGPQVGKAYKFLLDHRMEHGPATQEEAKAILLDWWSKQA
ncbi:CCA tRNA nucleotidyltransferase [Arachnia rubra]|uniref:CCA tRNA nucleotidyltransferase n=1 Tax=Arachnia rubra TaxID=1547448 RepID=A0ABX7Y647_9ACTN|nr:CCA tRNA nucleotidyltransferase [Arachnia rubra]MBB1578102.1 CCA tRNA nucleotidyltransferase [Propionibacterium sp.]QUC08343.1 CCA tRNA nucleotidyltransferase [Arachnia rubra]BCR79715.1 CCA tRNA nucleotidyltransferase [Arachnia rubra]